MKTLCLNLLAVVFGICHVANATPLAADNVAVVYNADSPNGRDLALEYMNLRSIPAGNLVPLYCPNKETITRDEFETSILRPLKRISRERAWWVLSDNKEKVFSSRKIHAMVLMLGMPLRIQPQPSATGEKLTSVNTNAASVDSELALMMFDDVPTKGMLNNPYFQKDEEINGSACPVLLVTRLDGVSPLSVRRMMKDSIEAEKSGLWGWAVIDKGGPHAQGDQWLSKTADIAEQHGMPLLLDTWKGTLPKNYPLPLDVAVYFGWYTTNINGPFLDPAFRFKPGAIAVHIHSFSADTLKKETAGWTSPLIEKGAAVSLGNVYEPFLGGTHHLHIFFERLLKGYTLAEAAGMSMPAVSWQSVVLGDPLYRPFAAQQSNKIVKSDANKYFQAWWLASKEWGAQPDLKREKLERAAASAGDRCFFKEALAYQAWRAGDKTLAAKYFESAITGYPARRDKARAEMELANMRRNGANDDSGFRNALDRLSNKYADTPYVEAMKEWKQRATPPPPPAPPSSKIAGPPKGK